ncbi:MAG: TIGR04282 family arsenosugar biosynthesis glycosyltransferase, partial [Leptospirales bacterium]
MNSSIVQIFFARPPVPGRVKTRLAEFMGHEAARDFYRATLAHVWRNFSAASEARPAAGIDFATICIASADPDQIELFPDVLREAGVTPDWPIFVQRGADLGERMACAFEDALALAQGGSRERVFLLTGTDIPFYDRDVVAAAVRSLDSHDAVLGPTPDGGYYLIGLRERVVRRPDLLRRIFSDLPWSTDQVRALQERRLADLGVSAGLAPELRDVDTYEDLQALVASSEESRSGANEKQVENYVTQIRTLLPDVRVILPILNEAENLDFVLR